MGFKCPPSSATGTERAGESTLGSTESGSDVSPVQGTSLQNGHRKRAPFKWMGFQILRHF